MFQCFCIDVFYRWCNNNFIIITHKAKLNSLSDNRESTFNVLIMTHLPSSDPIKVTDTYSYLTLSSTLLFPKNRTTFRKGEIVSLVFLGVMYRGGHWVLMWMGLTAVVRIC
jgi:hypothetical protein